MVLLETMWLAGVGAHTPSGFSPWTPHQARLTSIQTDGDGPLALYGTLLVRNVAFEKYVSVRFTLDGWSTMSDMYACYVEAAVHPPPSPSATELGPGWDCFTFCIPLADYSKDAETGGLSARELILAVRFTTPYMHADGVVWCAAGQGWTGTGASGAGEWWDNNGGRNYRVGFRWVRTHRDSRTRSKTTIPLTRPRISIASMTAFPPSSDASPARPPEIPTHAVGGAPTDTTGTARGQQASESRVWEAMCEALPVDTHAEEKKLLSESPTELEAPLDVGAADERAGGDSDRETSPLLRPNVDERMSQGKAQDTVSLLVHTSVPAAVYPAGQTAGLPLAPDAYRAFVMRWCFGGTTADDWRAAEAPASTAPALRDQGQVL
ncbi:putative phosphatase regulatory subunit-domain-containing protein [Mycena leptocephala]|nr:putative phosphatase regulatory subunit-domain-containing protein [Mycena leptocephala]